MHLVNQDTTVKEIWALFENRGNAFYDGEPITHSEHMLQAALLATEDKQDAELIIGALLHDIGHLLHPDETTEKMGVYGIKNHELLGANYLRAKGFCERVCSIIQHHVNAKRYLVAVDETYFNKLSEASYQTLLQQGGKMPHAELVQFEQHRYFRDIIQVRLYDEVAKNRHITAPQFTTYLPLLHQYLQKNGYQ